MKPTILATLPIVLLAGSLSAQSPGDALPQLLDRISDDVLTGPESIEAGSNAYEYRSLTLGHNGAFRIDIPWLRESAIKGGGVRIDAPEALELVRSTTDEVVGSVTHVGGYGIVVGDLHGEHILSLLASQVGANLSIVEGDHSFDADLRIDGPESNYEIGSTRVNTISSASSILMNSAMPGLTGNTTRATSTIEDALISTTFPSAMLDEKLSRGARAALFLDPWDMRFSAGAALSSTEGDTGIPGEADARVLTSSRGTSSEMKMRNGQLLISSISTGSTATLEGVSFSDAPLDLTLHTGSFMMELPIAPGAQGGEAILQIALRDLDLSESVWDLLDPSGALPRDALNLYIDVSAPVGSNVLLEDVQEMIRQEDMDALKAYVLALEAGEIRIDAMRIEMLGGSLSAQGSIDGVSLRAMLTGGTPDAGNWGNVTITLENTAATIKAIGDAGLVDGRQLGFGSMMLNMYSNLVEEDLRRTEIQLTGATVLVNGQRVR